MLVAIALTCVIVVLAFILLWQRQSAAAAQSDRWRSGYDAGRKHANAEYIALEKRSAAYESLIGNARGGVGKCISDLREALEALQAGGPLVTRNGQMSPLHLINGVDQFLAGILRAYAGDERDAKDAQMRLALRRPIGIYAQIADQAGCSKPGAVVGQNFTVAMAAGRIVIRSTGRNGGAGRILLARRDMTRFFNDALGKPRSWLADRNGGLVCRGFYRVDIKGDANFGQMVMVAATPSAGQLYLGSVDHENDQLLELRSLQKICQRLMDESASPAALRDTAERARVLRRGAPASRIPESGLCPTCDGDVTVMLRLGEGPANCPICAAQWGT